MYEDDFSNETSHGGSGDSGHSTQPKPARPKTSNNQKLRCAYCGKSFSPVETSVMPFCSRRCQQIDLGMWLNESYGMPVEGEAGFESGEDY